MSTSSKLKLAVLVGAVAAVIALMFKLVVRDSPPEPDPRGTATRALGHLVDLGPARGSSRETVQDSSPRARLMRVPRVVAESLHPR